ncbi:hypothetical protein [Pseudomonas sp.]|uniref:hypothetical protein n=1 Tax=Pseudomonas sp. TaxID=306 RepID=UPI002615C983|nr:hypothetical protein [Pseudomonas sp.]
MRLSSFIHDTLYEIALGVELARARAKDLVAISPSRLDGVQIDEKSYVEFDVSVLVTESAENAAGGAAKVGGEIKVASIGKISAELGGKSEKNITNSNEQTHRVAFKVPIYMHANFKDNPAAAEASEIILRNHLGPVLSG